MGSKSKTILDKNGLSHTIIRICDEIVKRNKTKSGLAALAIIGIRTRGDIIAKRIAECIKKKYKYEIPLGVLDITLYRDDLTTISAHPIVRSTDIPFDLTGKRIILVDDVLSTGRTIRAAMDAIVDFGRPTNIQLAILVDRGLREFPIQGDYVGASLSTKQNENVEVRLKESDGKDEIVLIKK